MSAFESLQGLYDDTRRLTVEPCFNGEVVIRIGDEVPIFVFAEDFQRIAETAVRESLAALPKRSDGDLG